MKQTLTHLRVKVTLLGIAVVATTAVVAAPTAEADDGWVAVANSPSHEQQDWGYGSNQATAESNALAACAQNERANNCRVLASSPDCIATLWDASQPINQLHASSGGGPDAVKLAVQSAAGLGSADGQTRCTWWVH